MSEYDMKARLLALEAENARLTAAAEALCEMPVAPCERVKYGERECWVGIDGSPCLPCVQRAALTAWQAALADVVPLPAKGGRA